MLYREHCEKLVIGIDGRIYSVYRIGSESKWRSKGNKKSKQSNQLHHLVYLNSFEQRAPCMSVAMSARRCRAQGATVIVLAFIN